MGGILKKRSCGNLEDIPRSWERIFGAKYRGRRNSYVETRKNMPVHIIPNEGEIIT